MSKVMPPDKIRFLSLTMENVRAFGDCQELVLHDAKGAPCNWNLMLGRNGVGKTTILQTLAHMRPVPAVPAASDMEDRRSTRRDAGEPDLTKAAISGVEDDQELYRIIRFGASRPTRIQAKCVGLAGSPFVVEVICEAEGEKLKQFDTPETKHRLESTGPLIIGYGAARHIGNRNQSRVQDRSATASLFDQATDLYDAEELLEQLHYAATVEHGGQEDRNLATMRSAAAALLGIAEADIEIRGPSMPTRPTSKSGVHVKTSSGIVVPLRELSMGYQTLFALTIDLAWRLVSAYPSSHCPLKESAIVLIDEIDLHLHPSWQRLLRRHLQDVFPSVQFIGTTHSPVTAQETLEAGENLILISESGEHATIHNRPLPSLAWGVEQILTSELFGFDSPRGPQAEKALEERTALLKKARKTNADKLRLAELNKFADDLPVGRTPQDVAYNDLVLTIVNASDRAISPK